MILWQQMDLVSHQWVTIGGWVMSAYLTQFTASTGLSSSLCTLQPDGIWYLCNGQYTDGTVLHLSDIRNAMNQSLQYSSTSTPDPEAPAPGGVVWGYYCYYGSSLPAGLQCFHMQDAQPKYINGVYTAGQYNERRVRRFAPGGEQNGYSTVNLWLNNQPVKVCNAESRYYASCYYRPTGPHDSSGNYVAGPGNVQGWNAAAGSLGVDTNGNYNGSTATYMGWTALAAAADVQPYDATAPNAIYYQYSVPGLSVNSQGFGFNGDAILLPSVLAEYRCGQPNTANLHNLATPAVPAATAAAAESNGTLWTPAQQHAADLTVYPFGYPNDGATGFTADGTALNTLSNPLEFTFSLGGANLNWYPLAQATFPWLWLSTADWPTQPDIYLAMQRLKHDVALEPYRLINDIITNDKDYRLLVTADYTYGGKEMELAYRTQGWDLPTYPPNFTPQAFNAQPAQGNRSANNSTLTGTQVTNFNYEYSSDSPWNDSTRIQMLSANSSEVTNPIVPLDLTWTQSSWSWNPDFGLYDGTAYNMVQPMWLQGMEYEGPGAGADYLYWAKHTIPAKTMSGILTMPAFISPAYSSDYKMRTLISRYFNMLLCGDPTIVQLTPSQQSFQTQFIPQISHRDKAQGCFQCHINVDPLASALSVSFGNPTYTGQPIADGQGEGLYLSEGQ